MTYKTNDGLSFNAETPEQVISAIRDSSKFDDGCNNNREYMLNFSERYKIAYGIILDTETPESFVESLLNHGYLLPT